MLNFKIDHCLLCLNKYIYLIPIKKKGCPKDHHFSKIIIIIIISNTNNMKVTYMSKMVLVILKNLNVIRK